MKRGELLPADETIEQHQKKRAEEIADVDEDRNGPKGLFKGMFPAAKRELIFDEGDGVYRCPRCLAEHEGGSICAHCRLPVEMGYDLSDLEDDFDPDDLENLEVDLDDAEEFGPAGFHFGPLHHRHIHGHIHGHIPHFHHHHYHHHDSDDSESDSELDHDIDDEEEEDEGSLREFVVQDDGEPQQPTAGTLGRIGGRDPINISDDESDEGGAISNRRRRRMLRPVIRLSSSPTGQSAISVSSTSVASEVSGLSEVSETDDAMLQRAGWSPLEPDSENEVDGAAHYPPYAPFTSDEENTDGSDTETIGHGDSDDDSDRSGTPRYEYPLYDGAASDDEDDDGSEPEAEMDHDGDTEMSASPSADRYRSRSVETDDYEYEMGLREPQGRGASQTPGAYGYGSHGTSRSASDDSDQTGYGAENLGEANEVHEMDDDSSDISIVPPSRRHRGQYANGTQIWQNYDPRISMILAEHQQIRGAGDPHSNLAQLDAQLRRVPVIVEPASRMRRMTAYRGQPPRRIDPLRSSRSPSATRINPSLNRSSRFPGQHQWRN